MENHIIYKLTPTTIEVTALHSDLSRALVAQLYERGQDFGKTVYVRIDDGILRWTQIDDLYVAAMPDLVKELILNPEAEVWNPNG